MPEVLLEEIVADVGEKIGDKLDEVTEERPWVRVLIRNLMYLVALAIAVYAVLNVQLGIAGRGGAGLNWPFLTGNRED